MKKLTIYTKGLAKDNPGPAAIAVVVLDETNKTVLELVETIGNSTHDYAEYFAVVRGLQALAEKFKEESNSIDFELQSESELVTNHLLANAQIKDVGLIGHFIEIYNLRVASFKHLTISQATIGTNKAVNQLVKEALDA